MNTDTIYLTDGGLETSLVFQHGIDLPHFASFPFLDKPQYKTIFSDYYRQYLELAIKSNTNFILESATWRANKDWGLKLGYSEKELIEVNKLATTELKDLKLAYADQIDSILVSGQMGPASDGYNISHKMSTEEASDYHSLQIVSFKEAGADMATALTINYLEEGMGITKSAKENNLPIIISFTLETDGKLPSGDSLQKAIEVLDEGSEGYPVHYMINCAHPSHFIKELEGDFDWKKRIGGIRANASSKSHAELDESTELDSGDREELAGWYKTLQDQLPNLRVYGGCCGTDVSHMEMICNKIF